MDDAVVCVVLVVALAAAVAATHDGRRDRKPATAVFTATASPWALVRDNPLYNGWYEQHLRCSFKTFDEIYQRIESRWCELHILPGPSSAHDIKTRVAVSLCYLAHEGSYCTAGSLFGVSKTRCIEYIDEVSNIFYSYCEQILNVTQLHRWPQF